MHAQASGVGGETAEQHALRLGVQLLAEDAQIGTGAPARLLL
jgi:hypothetical protein